jgi:hypothetical protein
MKLRFPADMSKPLLATCIINEQVTTATQGNPTRDVNGHYTFDPKSKNGYVNTVHCTVHGTEKDAEMTIGHAAVLRTREE